MNRKHIRNGLIGAALVLLAAAALVRGWDAPSLLPFKAEEVNEIEMYQYIVPAATQKRRFPARIRWHRSAAVLRQPACSRGRMSKAIQAAKPPSSVSIFRMKAPSRSLSPNRILSGALMVLCIRPRPILAVYGKPWMSPPSLYRKMNCSEAKEGNGNPFPFFALSLFRFLPPAEQLLCADVEQEHAEQAPQPVRIHARGEEGRRD